MPPSGRSSSSHSSSSRSSSSHSSSSRSSSYSSGPSHHSSSSHSYSSGSSYRSSSSHSSGWTSRSTPSRHSTSTRNPSYHSTSTHSGIPTHGVPIRNRQKQPTGYNQFITGYQEPMTYHCKNHDYVYYAVGWRDANTGTSYEPGYYDENGKYYDDIAFKDKTSGILTMKCEYCESVIRTNWTEGTKPNCPNCGAVLKIEKADELLNSYKESSYRNASYKPEAKSGAKWHPVIMILMLLMLLGGIMEREPIVALLAVSILVVSTPFVSKFLSKSAFIWTCIGLVVVCALLQSVVTDIRDDNRDNSGYTSGDNSFYVEPLGRSCDWYDVYDSYYDPETDCYFAYNYDSNTWQYWYEGISSDFGDYGWMEYDENEKQWYIETSNGHWEVLPAKYDTSKLWHISDDSDQATEAAVDQNINSGSIYVDALGRSCDWDDEYETFYDEETDCYFWYNTDINPPCWQYWYEGISSDFGDYGWMEYDKDEDQWYIEASQGNWIVLPKGYDTDRLWHIEE